MAKNDEGMVILLALIGLSMGMRKNGVVSVNGKNGEPVVEGVDAPIMTPTTYEIYVEAKEEAVEMWQPIPGLPYVEYVEGVTGAAALPEPDPTYAPYMPYAPPAKPEYFGPYVM